MWAAYWNGAAKIFFLYWVGLGLCWCWEGQIRLVGGWVFVMARLLLLYIVINTGKGDLTVFKKRVRGGIFV